MSTEQPSTLVVYESPNKYRLFKSLFEDIGLDCSYTYTQGRIFDIPDNKVGINGDMTMELSPVCQKRLNHLTSQIASHEIVFCLTDLDDEGEWIADSIRMLCNQTHGTTFFRLNLKSYTKDALISAIKQADESLNVDLVNSAISRRYIDRYIGYHENDKSLVRGRVLTPLLFSIYEDEIRLRKEIQIAFEDNLF